jgi:hypothetical protein
MAIMGVTVGYDWAQISYEGKDPLISELRKRAKEMGLRVVSGSSGNQVGPDGVVRLNMMTIMGNVNLVAKYLHKCESADVHSS